MIVCIINKNKDIYDAIKRTCCIEFGVPSQCVTSSILASPKQAKVLSVITKVAMQMNCKLGGELWGVRIPVNIKKKTLLNINYYLNLNIIKMMMEKLEKQHHDCWHGRLQGLFAAKQIGGCVHRIDKWHS